MKEELIIIVATWLARTLIDLGVKYSKTTENTIDDYLFNRLNSLVSPLKNMFKKK
jgi:hypothetical protein